MPGRGCLIPGTSQQHEYRQYLMSDNYSFFDMIVNASFVVQVVMALLMVASVTSWTIIIRKRRLLNQALSGSDAFENSFWSGGDLNAIYRDITRGKTEPADMAGLFEAGFREFRRLTAQQNMSPDQVLDGVRRMMHVAQMREMDRLEESLSTLATIGSTSPYVGLFGTVWGIMNSFASIAASKNTTLAVVAPGIAEALFATALGLVAAIPAVLAYNKLSGDIGRYAQRLEAFAGEFGAILSRQLEEKR